MQLSHVAPIAHPKDCGLIGRVRREVRLTGLIAFWRQGGSPWIFTANCQEPRNRAGEGGRHGTGNNVLARDAVSTDERFRKLLEATPQQLEVVDRVLQGWFPQEGNASEGPLLLGMTAAAKLLGVSRATLWRMIRDGRLSKVELLRGSYRLRRGDIEAIANGGKPEGQ